MLTKRDAFRAKALKAADQIHKTESRNAIRQRMTHSGRFPDFKKFDSPSFVKGAMWVYDTFNAGEKR